MNNIPLILNVPGRKWHRENPATIDDISKLHTQLPFQAPDSYINLLMFSNGGEGELALPPLWLQLFDIQFVIQFWQDSHYRKEFPYLFFFASNGGLESIAFNMEGQEPWPIVMVDCIAGLESAKQIANNIEEFIQAIGVAEDDNVA